MMYISGRWIGVRASDLGEEEHVQRKFKAESPAEFQDYRVIYEGKGMGRGEGVKFRREFLHLMSFLVPTLACSRVSTATRHSDNNKQQVGNIFYLKIKT